MKYLSNNILLFLALWMVACKYSETSSFQTFEADHPDFRYSGRVDKEDAEEVILIGAASFVEIAFTGDSIQVLLKKLNPKGVHNYVVLELDGEYLGRRRLDSDTIQSISIVASRSEETHMLKVMKATEAANGNIAFGGVKALEIKPLSPAPDRAIEFIGNSITCGMGVDYEEIPCGSGEWYDQHNAYMAYGPQIAEAFNARYILSCVSGIGVYRNWNSNPGEDAVMPDVYENLYLDTNDDKPMTFDFQPQLVSIALGTNDFSEGDGEKERQPFDSTQFISSYIDFVKLIYEKYPDTQVVLITSPMVSGENGTTFLNSLKAVQDHFKFESPDTKPIAVYNFESIEPHGCGYHPDKNDQQQMADQLIPFYKEVMGW